MRDAQSLLEQLLSFGGERLTVELVQQQLGIASDDRTLDLLDALSRRDASEAIRLVDQTSSAGVQPTELLGGALEFLRDVMMVSVKAEVTMLATSPRQKPRLREIAERWPLDTILAAMQILDEAKRRLRGSPHGRTLVEIAILRVARLDNLIELGEVVARLAAQETGASPISTSEKKKLTDPEPSKSEEPAPRRVGTPEVTSSAAVEAHESIAPEPERSAPIARDLESIAAGWPGWVASLEKELSSRLVHLRPTSLPEPGLLVIEPKPGYNHVVDACDQPNFRVKIESSLRQWLGGPMAVQFRKPVEAPVSSPGRHPSAIARSEGLDDEPIVKLILELFEARAVRVEVEEDQAPAEP
jgi:DNA polymerase-3 subunit gamma/tau